MALLADILLLIGAVGAGLYCTVLSRRLSKLTNLETGVGGAIATLSNQVDDMSTALNEAQTATNASANSLSKLTSRAEGAAQRLELLVASLHDLPTQEERSNSVQPQASATESDSTIFHSRRKLQNADL